jgi:hypothetical protein
MATAGNPTGATELAMWNQCIVGIAVAILAAGALYAFAAWEEWTNVALGRLAAGIALASRIQHLYYADVECCDHRRSRRGICWLDPG